MASKVRLAIVGAGNRGSAYARIAHSLPHAEVVAVAEPRDSRRQWLADACGVDASMQYVDWRPLLGDAVGADLVVIATQDFAHEDPAVAFMEAGYDVLLEKPMAPSRAEARRIVSVSERTGRRLVVAHVLRYQPYTKQLMALVGDGVIGEVVTVDHLEPIGDLHFAHSYVRGNWRREDLASSALMSKSCHDIDWIAAAVGRPAVRVASFGSLHHFREDAAPPGSGSRCLSCSVEPDCAFSAKRFYLGALEDSDGWRWPLSVVAEAPTEEAVLAALESGPYGRCVYRSDNDVVDHQVVIIEFDGGATASFTMSAFTEQGHRRSRIGGTRGHLEGDGERIRHFDYLTRTTATYQIEASRGASAADGHGGGDVGLITDVVAAIRDGDWSSVPTDARESLETHEIVWAAESARREGTAVALDPFAAARPKEE